MSVNSRNFMMWYQRMTDCIGNQRESIKNSVSKAQKWAFWGTLLMGLVAHIPAIANDLINHDSINGLNANANYWLSQQGKWAAGHIVAFLRGVLTVPSWFVLLGIFFAACSAVLITRMFHIKSPMCAALIGSILIANDAVMSMTLAYGTDYFLFCFLLMVLAVYLTRMIRFGWIIGVPLITLSLGGYQPLIGVVTSLFVLLCIVDALHAKLPFKKVLFNGLKYIGILLLSGGIYYGILQILVANGSVVLNSYKNINSLATGEMLKISSILSYLKDSWVYTYNTFAGVQSVPYRSINILNVLCSVAIIASFSWSVFKNKTFRSPMNFIAAGILLFGVYPIAVNLVDFLTQDEIVSRIMGYSIVLVYCVPIILCDNGFGNDEEIPVTTQNEQTEKKSCFGNQILRGATCLIMVVTVLNWCSLNHDAYGYVGLSNKQMESKTTILMSSIYNCEGYKEGVPVVLLGNSPFPFFDDTYSATSLYLVRNIKKGTQGIYSASDTMYRLILVERMINVRLGGGLDFIDAQSFYEQHAEVCDAMPNYPTAGSVKNIDGTIVVKLNEIK